MKSAFFFAFLGLWAAFCSASALAQNVASPKASLYGLTEGQIGQRFGKPDSVREKSKTSTEWVYGQSTVFFLEGKVSAWSDAGELAQRERLTALQSDKSARDDSLSEEWVNPWTPPNRGAIAAENLNEVLDD